MPKPKMKRRPGRSVNTRLKSLERTVKRVSDKLDILMTREASKPEMKLLTEPAPVIPKS